MLPFLRQEPALLPKRTSKICPPSAYAHCYEPSARVAIDLVGPLSPPFVEHKYILTLIDYSTGFPEALQLKDVDSISVAESLLTIF